VHLTFLRCVSVCALCLFLAGCSGSREPEPVDAGTVPAAQDRDGDGILDTWETDGIPYIDPTDGSSQILDLKALGASPAHKDILLWLAWMESPTHSHKPDTDALGIVQRAFRNAPVSNLDGFPGINLHIVLSRVPIVEQAMLGSVSGTTYNWSAFDALKKQHLPAVLQGTAFFSVFAHYINANHSSGLARSIPGRDLIVSLGGFTQNVGTSQEKAGTLMHELGHTLGLQHGGTDNRHYKPNYLSVMNYFFQLNGLAINNVQGNFDYSRFPLDAEESSLNESRGLTSNVGMAKYSSLYKCCRLCKNSPGQPVQIVSIAAARVDWNCDASYASTVRTDVNGDNEVSKLSGADDWSRIVLKPTGASAGAAPGLAPDDEITPSQADELPLLPVSGVVARPIGNGVLVEWKQVPLDRVVAYRVYRAAAGSAPEFLTVVENVDQPSFADIAPQPGALAYSVTAVFVPHAVEPTAPGPPPAPPVGRLGAPGREALGGWIDRVDLIRSIVEAAPAATAELETLGGVVPQSRDEKPFVRMLRETVPSLQTRVKVQ
jgi:hypothetical protein